MGGGRGVGGGRGRGWMSTTVVTFVMTKENGSHSQPALSNFVLHVLLTLICLTFFVNVSE